jgi:hypothetical protein
LMLKASVLTIGALALAGTAATLQAQTADDVRPRGEVSLSDDTLQLRYLDSGRKYTSGRTSQISAGFFLSEERDIVLMGDVLFPAQLDYDRLQIMFGPRVYAALLEEENDDVLAASLGLEFRWEIDSRSGLAIAGQGYYAPDILTFGSADNLTDLSARIEMRLQPRLTIFGGMRWFEFEAADVGVDQTLQEELFAGVGWRF